MEKQYLREEMKKRRSMLSSEEIVSESQKIHAIFLNSKEYKESTMIYCYASYKNEVETISLMEQMLREEKRVAVPCVTSNTMDFYEITDVSQLSVGTYGILEPVRRESKNERPLEETILMVVPLLAYDEDYNRIGYGKGYYDRYFHTHGEHRFFKLGFAYEFQRVDHITFDAYDVALDDVCSIREEEQ